MIILLFESAPIAFMEDKCMEVISLKEQTNYAYENNYSFCRWQNPIVKLQKLCTVGKLYRPQDSIIVAFIIPQDLPYQCISTVQRNRSHHAQPRGKTYCEQKLQDFMQITCLSTGSKTYHSMYSRCLSAGSVDVNWR